MPWVLLLQIVVATQIQYVGFSKEQLKLKWALIYLSIYLSIYLYLPSLSDLSLINLLNQSINQSICLSGCLSDCLPGFAKVRMVATKGTCALEFHGSPYIIEPCAYPCDLCICLYTYIYIYIYYGHICICDTHNILYIYVYIYTFTHRTTCVKIGGGGNVAFLWASPLNPRQQFGVARIESERRSLLVSNVQRRAWRIGRIAFGWPDLGFTWVCGYFREPPFG